jgi:hypothetical protein
MAAGDGEGPLPLLASLISHTCEGARRLAVQDHPQDLRVGRVGSAPLIGRQPRRPELLDHAHAGRGGPVGEQVGQPDRQYVGRHVAVDPAERTQLSLLRGAVDHLRPGGDAVLLGVRHHPGGCLGHGQPGVAHGQARVGPPRESGARPQRPLTERLVDRQPARKRPALQVGRAHPPRIGPTLRSRGPPGRDDRGARNHVALLVDGRQLHGFGEHDVQPADQIGGGAVGEPVPDHPPFTGAGRAKIVARRTSHARTSRRWTSVTPTR